MFSHYVVNPAQTMRFAINDEPIAAVEMGYSSRFQPTMRYLYV